MAGSFASDLSVSDDAARCTVTGGRGGAGPPVGTSRDPPSAHGLMERGGSTNSLRVLLDNQQWNYLAAPGEYPDGAGLDADDLGDAVRCGEIEVVGSIDILQEIIESARTRAVKYGRMIGLFFEFVGRRVLIPLNDRHPREAGDGGLLSDGRGYLSRDDRRQLERLANNRRDVVHVADDLYAEKTSFAHQETVLRQKMRQKLNDEIEDFKFPNPRGMVRCNGPR